MYNTIELLYNEIQYPDKEGGKELNSYIYVVLLFIDTKLHIILTELTYLLS